MFEPAAYLSLFSVALAISGMIYFALAYRASRIEGQVHNRLENLWSAVPIILVLFIFGWGLQ